MPRVRGFVVRRFAAMVEQKIKCRRGGGLTGSPDLFDEQFDRV